MTDKQLQQLVEQISLEFFAKPFKHQATFNSRLKTTGGRYHLASHNIDINPLMLTEFSRENLIGVIKHELCHYHLHLAGAPSNHRSKEFKSLLLAVGGSRYAPKTSKAKPSAKLHHYRCLDCGQRYDRQRLVNTTKYRCGKCHGKLQLISA
ncbi:hypothetical protein FC56_GL000101 [Lentilactobacillus senioris DSM 24302 = JCM 17472]|uniref:SprT-like domain-containing protein n=1 Tax=Lentilactobacillus senioris DSM 24302 = JCM 17472 TaxID=1423802 RepID=A0A0R2CNV9_9LACO|nr:SprT family protein [Lentilactobacillus senioris]KRM93389.1 hypothetical protein FC56_GL000101 [Lentilactobacillus senioris DSM 24302 = JCM 17472]